MISFLELPREIRDLIYQKVTDSALVVCDTLESHEHHLNKSGYVTAIKLELGPMKPPSHLLDISLIRRVCFIFFMPLLLSNKTVHNELLETFGKRFTFTGIQFVSNCHWKPFNPIFTQFILKTGNPVLFANIRHISITLPFAAPRFWDFRMRQLRDKLPNLHSVTLYVENITGGFVGVGAIMMEQTADELTVFGDVERLSVNYHTGSYARKLVEKIDPLVGQREFPCERYGCWGTCASTRDGGMWPPGVEYHKFDGPTSPAGVLDFYTHALHAGGG